MKSVNYKFRTYVSTPSADYGVLLPELPYTRTCVHHEDVFKNFFLDRKLFCLRFILPDRIKQKTAHN